MNSYHVYAKNEDIIKLKADYFAFEESSPLLFYNETREGPKIICIIKDWLRVLEVQEEKGEK